MVGKKIEKANLDIIPKTNEEYISILYECIRFTDSYRFLSSCLEDLGKNFENDGFKVWKKEFPDKWMYIIEKLAYPYEDFKSFEVYQKPIDNLKKNDFFSKLKNKYPCDEEVERTKEVFELFQLANFEEVTKLFCKSDVFY